MASSASSLQVQLQKMYVDGMKDVQKIANEATEKEMAFNSAEAEKSREYQTQMSNTSHQREVEDLKKAGLNPILSANGGAMSYTGAQASASAKDASGSAGSMMTSMMSSLGSFVASKYASDSSAAATKYAANKSYAAAAAAASATRYAADKQYAAQKYSVDHTPKGLATDILQKLYKNTGLKGLLDNKAVYSQTQKIFSNVFKIQSFVSTSKANQLYAQKKDSAMLKSAAGTAVTNLGFVNNAQNRYNYTMFLITGNKSFSTALNKGQRMKVHH